MVEQENYYCLPAKSMIMQFKTFMEQLLKVYNHIFDGFQLLCIIRGPHLIPCNLNQNLKKSIPVRANCRIQKFRRGTLHSDCLLLALKALGVFQIHYQIATNKARTGI